MEDKEKIMRKVYMSFLGTSNYLACNYISGPLRMNEIRFVQEATVSWWCHDWQQGDRILIFVTDEAKEKNWLNNGHKKNDGTPISCSGLESRLASLELSADIKMIKIHAGRSEEEIWEIFSIVVNELNDEDKLYIDITHAFRSLPLLATVIINYAKVVKKIQVKAISYGAIEVLGSLRRVRELDIKDRDVPVFDLLPFDQLLDWSTAIDRFVVSGNATGICDLTATNVILRKKEVRGPDREADSLKKMADALLGFSQTLATCRGKNIVKHAEKLKKTIGAVKKQQLIKPLTPLLEKLSQTVAAFSNDEVRDGATAARWCLEHNLVQQGFTLLQETMCTFILRQSTQEDTRDKNKRNLVGMAVAIERDSKNFEKWSDDAKQNKKNIEDIRAWLRENKELFDCMKNLSQDRNDLNHAGMNANPMTAEKFSRKLEEYIKIFESQIYDRGKQ